MDPFQVSEWVQVPLVWLGKQPDIQMKSKIEAQGLIKKVRDW